MNPTSGEEHSIPSANAAASTQDSAAADADMAHASSDNIIAHDACRVGDQTHQFDHLEHGQAIGSVESASHEHGQHQSAEPSETQQTAHETEHRTRTIAPGYARRNSIFVKAYLPNDEIRRLRVTEQETSMEGFIALIAQGLQQQQQQPAPAIAPAQPLLGNEVHNTMLSSTKSPSPTSPIGSEEAEPAKRSGGSPSTLA
jgi:hypothetical protein